MTDTMRGLKVFLAMTMLLVIGLAALVLLAQVGTTATAWRAQPVAHQITIDWLRPDQVHVPTGLAINTHAAKHHGDTERIYANLLQGKCADVAKFCGGSESEFAYFCVDPVTGIVGAILQIGDEITTGFYEKSGSGYWVKRVPREQWEVCE